MKDIQNVLLTLLKEFDEICKKNNIEYMLGGRTALSAYECGGFSDNAHDLFVLVRSKDAKRLKKAVLAQITEDRFLESMESNHSFPGIHMFYGSKRTLDLDTSSWGNYTNHGIHLTIEFLRPKNKFGKLRQLIEYAWEMSIMTSYSFHRFSAPFIYRFILAKGDPSKGEVVHIYGKRSPVTISSGKALASGSVDFEGFEVPIANDTAGFLSRLFKSGSEGVLDIMGKYDTESRLIDAGITYEEFRWQASKDNVDIDHIWNLRSTFIRKYRRVALINLKIRKAWNHMFLCGDRYALWNIYAPQKDELIRLFSECRYEELKSRFALYRELADKYLKSNLGLCFDKEIFDIFCETLKMNGEGAYVEKLKNCVPSRHLKPIELIDYKGNRV